MLRLLGAGLLTFALPCIVFASALVESVKGNIQAAGATLRPGERIFPQSTLTTGAGSQARLRFDDGMIVLLEERSQLRLVDFQHASGGPNNRVVMDLLAGAARFITGEIARTNPKQFFVRTPQASFGVLGQGDFSIVLAKGAYVSVSRGTVIAANRAATVSLVPGPTNAIASAGAMPEPAAAPPAHVGAALGSLGAAAAPRPAATAAPAAAPVPAARDAPYVFLGASVGRSDIDESITRGLITSGSVNGEGTGFKVFGGYQFHRNFGAEIAFVDLGEAKYEGDFSGMPVSGGKLQVRGLNLAALGRLPLSTRFALFAKIGLFLWEVEANDVTPAGAFSAKTDGSSASFGIGASFDIGRNVALRAEAESFRVDKDNASLLSLGVAFSF